MISGRTGTEKTALDDNDSSTSEEGIHKVVVVAEVIIMSSGVKTRIQKLNRVIFNREWFKVVEY